MSGDLKKLAGGAVGQSAFLLLLGALVFLSYSNILDGPWVFDDTDTLAFPLIRIFRLSIEGLRLAAFHGPWSLRPLANLSLALDHLAGSGFTPAACRVTAIALHLVAAAALFLLLRRALARLAPDSFFGAELTAALVVSLWALSPALEPVVAHASERPTLLGGLFSAWMLFFYLDGRLAQVDSGGRRGRARILLSTLFYLLALLSRESAWAAPLLVFVLEGCVVRPACRVPGGEGSEEAGKPPAFPILPAVFFIFLALLAAGVYWTHARDGQRIAFDAAWRTHLPTGRFSVLERMASQPRVLAYLASEALFPLPARANPLGAFDISRGLSPAVLSSFLFAGLLIFYALQTVRRRPLVSFALLWFLAGLAPALLFPLGVEILSVRSLYLPSLGAAGLAAMAISRVGRSPAGRFGATLLCLLLLALASAGTVARNRDRLDRGRLYEMAYRKDPEGWLANFHLGRLLLEEGKIHESWDLITKAAKSEPERLRAYYERSFVQEKRYQIYPAIDECLYVLKHDPTFTPAYLRAAELYYGIDMLVFASKYSREALAIEPENPRALTLFGKTKAAEWKILKKRQGAEEQYVAFEKKEYDYGKLGGLYKEAKEALARSIELYPPQPEAIYALGDLLAAAGEIDGAEKVFYSIFEKLPPSHPARCDAWQKLGILSQSRRFDLKKAEAYYINALQCDPGRPAFFYNLGSNYYGQKRYEKACLAWRKALSLDPGFESARHWYSGVCEGKAL